MDRLEAGWLILFDKPSGWTNSSKETTGGNGDCEVVNPTRVLASSSQRPAARICPSTSGGEKAGYTNLADGARISYELVMKC